MTSFISKGLSFAIVAFALLHFVTVFWQSQLLITLLSITGLVIFLFGWLSLSFHKFKLPIFLFFISAAILIFSGTPPLKGVIYGAIQMREIIGLLVVVPLISWVLAEEPYIEDIISLFHRYIDTSKRFYFMLMTFTQIISYFLLFGSITMMYQFTNMILEKQTSEAWENYKGTALLRAFALSTLWVISIPSFIFAVTTLHASLWITILQGLGITVCGIFLAILFSHFQEKKYQVALTPVLQKEIQKLLTHASSKRVQKQKSIEFLLLFFTLFGTIFLLHALFDFPLMILIPITIFCWVGAFFIYKKRSKKFLLVLNTYRKEEIQKQVYQLSTMICVGILIFALKQTSFATLVVGSLDYIQDNIAFLNPLYFLPFIVIFLGFFSLGPLTVMVLVAGILESMALPYPPELIVLAITSGSVISILISPLIMPVIVLSAANKLSLFTNGFRFNIVYAIVFYIIVQIYIQTMITFW